MDWIDHFVQNEKQFYKAGGITFESYDFFNF